MNLKNDRGFVLVASILVLAVLTVAGLTATRTATTESQIVRNEGELIETFYNVEAGSIDALENSSTWLTDSFLSASETTANTSFSSSVTDSSGSSVAQIEIRCVESTGTSVSGLSSAANSLPQQTHVVPPPSGSGYSLKYFEVRRYGVTTTSTDGNTCIQTGAWKIFNKF